MKTLTPELVKTSFGKLGYAWHPTLNLVGIRSTLNVSDVFNDLFVATWTQPTLPLGLSVLQQQQFLNTFLYTGKDGTPLKEDGDAGPNTLHALAALKRDVGQLRSKAWAITTDPGAYYAQNPLDAKGTAVLVPGQYKNAYLLGNHQGKADHPALVQRGGEVSVYRDNDRDALAEEQGSIVKGYFGINIHRTVPNGESAKIGKWSAGCQVFQRHRDHQQLLALCTHFYEQVNGRYTYTLLREKELG